MMKNLLLLFLFIVSPSVAVAGGDFEQVTVESLTISDDTNFELVVRPTNPDRTSVPVALGNCTTLRVTGTYSRWHSWRGFPKWVTYEDHLAALKALERALASKQPINFGWIGRGLVPPNPKEPCNVSSRALNLQHTDREDTILSLHNHV